MESRLYVYPRCRKDVKSTSGLTRHINSCKILITLPSHQPSTLAPILEYNTTNHPDFLSDKFEENISPGVPNNNNEKIRLADITNNVNENSRPANIDEQRPTTLNWIP